MENERLYLISILNNKVISVLNRMSLEELEGLMFDFIQGDVFTCEAKRNGHNVDITEEERLRILDFFKNTFSENGIGILIENSEIHLGTSHLLTSDLKRLNNLY